MVVLMAAWRPLYNEAQRAFMTVVAHVEVDSPGLLPPLHLPRSTLGREQRSPAGGAAPFSIARNVRGYDKV